INTEHKLSLSGTPIENSLDDLWSQMQFINPSILGNYSFFKQHYKTPIGSQKSEKTLETLKKIIDPFILRRTKKQVAKDLPELTQLIHYCEMSQDQSQAYNEELSKIRNHLLGLDKNVQYKMHVFSALMRLRQMANHPRLALDVYLGDSGKMDAIMDVALPILAGKNKILLFSSFESHLSIIKEAFQTNGYEVQVISGSTSPIERQHILTEFKATENEAILLMTLKTGGVGLNLQEADYVFILDPWWNPFAESQAISRAHRIGRKSQVIAYKFITKDTIEEKIMALQKAKQEISDEFLEMSSLDHLTVSELEQLIE
ncbi:MAG: DEAD/DEAH box helicase, partial [Saprospiraceae bacterium]|nr:DEAD/DEAH box helicase [Saprospiraceae bacterium]